MRIARLFATVEACGATFRSTCRVSTPSPVWDEAGVVPLSDDWEGLEARVVVWDRTLSSRPVRLGRRDVPLVNLRANGGASCMDLNLVTRGGEGKGTTHAAGTVRVAMEVRTSAAGRDGSDGGDGGVEPGDETVDETVAESAADDANEDEDEDEDDVDAATRSAAGEATVSSTVSSKAATVSSAVAAAKEEPAPRTPSTPTVTPTVSIATPIVVSAPSSTSSSLAASTASLRSKLVDAGRVADAAECIAFEFKTLRAEFDSSRASSKEGSSGGPRRELTGRRELAHCFGWSARTPPRHPVATVRIAGKENRPPDAGEDDGTTAPKPVTHHPVTHHTVRGPPVAEFDSAMAAGGRVAPRRATDGFERVDALDSARRALAKARLFGGESVRERAVPLEAPGAKKKPSNAFNTSDDDAEHEQRREVRRLARVFARADRVFASWSL